NLTLSNGLAIGSYAWGGAILSLGTLSLNHVTVQGSVAQGQLRNGAYGGGVFSNGLLAVANSTIQSNQALGGDGYFDQNLQGGGGGQALGGGLYVGGGTATLTNTTLSSNLAQGGAGANGGQIKLGWFKQSNAHYAGGPGGNGYGGGIFVGAGTLDLTGTTITQNAARGGIGGNSPAGRP